MIYIILCSDLNGYILHCSNNDSDVFKKKGGGLVPISCQSTGKSVSIKLHISYFLQNCKKGKP